MYTKANLAALRVKKDIAELSRQRLNASHATTSINFPDGTRNLLKLKVGVSMTAGLYEGATFYFLLSIPPSYPFHAPTVVCTTRAWHPNINLHTGFVSLPILTKDWRPVLSINTVVFALQLMFLEPTEQLPVNETAAAAMATPGLFRQQVQRTLAGGFLFGVQFEPHTQGGDVGMGGGAGSVAKRKRGEGMDTEAVQTTLQAMRIQEDESAEDPSSPSSWDKRPRHHQQPNYLAALAQQPPRQEAGKSHSLVGQVAGGQLPFGGEARLDARGVGAAVGGGGAPHHNHQQQPSPPAAVATPFASANFGGTAFDRLTYRALGDAEASATAAGSVGLRCGGGVGGMQARVAQSQAGVVGEGTAAVGWGGGRFQTTRLE